MRFDFATAGRILFGEGRAAELGTLAREFGSRALVVRGRGRRVASLLETISAAGLVVAEFEVPEEPDVALVQRGRQLAMDGGCELVIAVGGGSVLDAGKAIAALLTNPGEVLQYLEVVGEGKPLKAAPAPFLAVPTTAGTGSEVTRNAVLAVPDQRVKVSLRSPLMLPAVALVDPDLTRSLPPATTASTGMDALTQCIEPFVSPHANPLTDGFAREGMRRAAGALRRAFHDGDDREARREMSIASLCGGLALANAKLGAVHGIAGPLGGMCPVPHGVACARLLAPVMNANVRALRERQPDSPALPRYAEIARTLTGRADARPEDGAEWVQALVEELQVPPLIRFGADAAIHPQLVPAARRSSSMRGNPVELTDGEIAAVLAEA